VKGATKLLLMPLRPTDDAYITCIVCHQDQVEFEFTSRSPNARLVQGIHQRCAETIGDITDPKK